MSEDKEFMDELDELLECKKDCKNCEKKEYCCIEIRKLINFLFRLYIDVKNKVEGKNFYDDSLDDIENMVI